MSYQLGIDLGTTFAAAAVARGGAARMLGLGARATAIPSAVFMAPGGELFFGEAAEQRGRVDPDGLVVGFKRRVGDSESIRLRGTPISPQLLSARLLGWVYRKACELEGGPPDRLVLTHPANWAGYRLSLLDEIVQLARVGEYERLAEPEAAAVYYASFTRVETGSVIAVYDLGGGTFDVTVLRKEPTRFELIGAPRGVDRLGGIDFDDAIVGRVLDVLEHDLATVDMDSDAVRADLVVLRQECVQAKELLSTNPEAVIPVRLGDLRQEIRITRPEFEGLVRSLVDLTVDCLRDALADVRVGAEELRCVLLIGGSSRVPLVGRLIATELRVATAVDAHPKEAVALGAAIYGTSSTPVARAPRGTSPAVATNWQPSAVEQTKPTAIVRTLLEDSPADVAKPLAVEQQGHVLGASPIGPPPPERSSAEGFVVSSARERARNTRLALFSIVGVLGVVLTIVLLSVVFSKG